MAVSATAETVRLRTPSKYATSDNATSQPGPAPLQWLLRTWTVTHSTLSMWRTARNVRITYKPLSALADGRARIDDLVEYQSNKSPTLDAKVKTVVGVDTAAGADTSVWDWRGKGFLFWVTSHWEVLGWGERVVNGKAEKWAVTWFQKTAFTAEGVDIYCDNAEGLSEETYGLIVEALKGLEAKSVATMVEKDMRPVEIKLA